MKRRALDLLTLLSLLLCVAAAGVWVRGYWVLDSVHASYGGKWEDPEWGPVTHAAQAFHLRGHLIVQHFPKSHRPGPLVHRQGHAAQPIRDLPGASIWAYLIDGPELEHWKARRRGRPTWRGPGFQYSHPRRAWWTWSRTFGSSPSPACCRRRAGRRPGGAPCEGGGGGRGCAHAAGTT